MFTMESIAGWGDMDFNGHMRNTAYLDKAADARMTYFANQGFAMSEFKRLSIGPVIIKDELHYFKEIHLLQKIVVTLELLELDDSGSQFCFKNQFIRQDGNVSAVVISKGGWLSLTERKWASPPEKLLAVLLGLKGEQ